MLRSPHWSRSPLVCVSRLRIVIGCPPNSGTSGRYFRMSSSSESLRSCDNRTIAAAVNCFATEPLSNTVESVFGMSYSRLAAPYALMTSGLPFFERPTPHPGVLRSYRAKIASTLGERSEGSWATTREAIKDAAKTANADEDNVIAGLGAPRNVASDPRRICRARSTQAMLINLPQCDVRHCWR